MKRNGFTVVEILIATVIVVFAAGATYTLLGSAAQFGGRRPHSYDAFNFAAQTLDTLKEYVTGNAVDAKYRIGGDLAAGPECPGVSSPAKYALRDNPVVPGPETHRHALPANSLLERNLDASRCYTVQDVDLAPTVDTNNDGNPANDADVKRVTVTVRWREPR